ncbi:hypothetical protein CRENBAI_008937 [Crenichthys baileyi]|uniref:C-type lectin domain-containing protein n=1 Tax=Crenichthys baileyi TaxID=28760 RepID=A0AAV9R7H2_9TELE
MTRTSGLVFLLLAAQIPASQTLTSTGKEFIVVFPENIAYYHPSSPENKIWITALHNDTVITMSPSPAEELPQNLAAGETKSFERTEELGKLDFNNNLISTPFKVFSISDKSIRITSSKDVVVQAISIRKRSVQSALVIPADKLSMKYFLPPVPEIEGTTDQGVLVVNVTERGPFRLIIINPSNDTVKVAIKGGDEISGDIESGKVAQIWVNNTSTPQFVEADKPVAVFFSHPCAMQYDCTCGLLHAMLPPAKNHTVKFPVPPVLAEQASILLSDQHSRRREHFRSHSAVVQSAGTAILYRPTLLLTLIPEEEFGSCFVVPFIENKKNFLIIVVHNEHKDGIHIGKVPLKNADWLELNGTDYVSTNISTSSPNTFVWHTSSTMAVYFVGNENNTWFGNPAPVVSVTPDFRGCAVTPEVIKILDDANSWQNSIQSCEDTGLNLISLSNNSLQKQVCSKLPKNGVQKVWIGMRRSSMTGDWYWLNNDPFNNTNWAPGEQVGDGQCGVMSLKSSSNCGWNDEDCCKAIHPVCYRDPVILQI